MRAKDGLVVIVNGDCPTCRLVAPVFDEIDELTVVNEDESLELSFALEVETVPTLVRIVDGEIVDRTVGWSRDIWRKLTGIEALGEGLPEHRPGCGSRTLEIPKPADTSHLRSRRVVLGRSF